MKKHSFILIIIMIFNLNCSSQETNQLKNLDKMILEYSDSNGNYYKITKGRISFEPIKREMSSSGNYDGGEAKNNNITIVEFNLIYKEFEAILKNKNIQIPNRMKTSGRLRLSNGDDTKAVIIKKTDEQKQLELLLNELLKQ